MFEKKDKGKETEIVLTPPIIEEKPIGQIVENGRSMMQDFDRYREAKEGARKRKRRFYKLTLLVRKIRIGARKLGTWLSDNRDLVLLVALSFFSALVGYLLAFMRLHFSFKEIALGVWDFFYLAGSVALALIVFVSKLYMPSGVTTQEISREATKKEIGDDGRTIC